MSSNPRGKSRSKLSPGNLVLIFSDIPLLSISLDHSTSHPLSESIKDSCFLLMLEAVLTLGAGWLVIPL